MSIFISKTTIYTVLNRRTRFVPETEPLEPCLIGFAGSIFRQVMLSGFVQLLVIT